MEKSLSRKLNLADTKLNNLKISIQNFEMNLFQWKKTVVSKHSLLIIS